MSIQEEGRSALKPGKLAYTFRLLAALSLFMPLAMRATGTGTGTGTAAAAEIVDFPQTGYALSDEHGFLTYWRDHGGLPQFGYPLTPETVEVSPTDGRTYITQWFERNRFEFHPENSDPRFQVLLGLLGRDLAKGRDSEPPFRPTAKAPAADCRYFPETGHSVCRTFRAYWENNGGLALYGYPISEEFQEKNRTDGKTYTVQYFERNRFEFHPENSGTQYEVLLGLLGVQIGGFPVRDLPRADTPTLLQVPDRFKNEARWKTPHALTGPAGMTVSLFGLADGARMMAVAPNGDLFVSERNAGRIAVLLDRNNDGVADNNETFVEGLSKPHGLAFHNGYLYVATEAAVLRYPYRNGQIEANARAQRLADLPSGPGVGLANDVNHDTRSIAFGPDGKMYVSIGSSCDLCEETDPRRASIMQFNDDGTGGRVFAGGLRNAVGIDFDPTTGRLWASVNERNKRGNDTPPDLLTPIRSGGNYGWPYCMGVPLTPDPAYGRSSDFCGRQESAALPLPAHIAPLGIRVVAGQERLPRGFEYGVFIANHGSALHDPPYGYDVRYVSLRPGKMAQGAQVVISGWFAGGSYWGRPVDIVFGKDKALYISDDAAGAVYRVDLLATP